MSHGTSRRSRVAAPVVVNIFGRPRRKIPGGTPCGRPQGYDRPDPAIVVAHFRFPFDQRVLAECRARRVTATMVGRKGGAAPRPRARTLIARPFHPTAKQP